MRPLIENGYVYIAQPPLYKMTYKKDDIVYAYSDEDQANIIKEKGNPSNTQRYKGLGEMNSEQLWETTMNPETRQLIQISIDDAEAAEEMVSLCMGEVIAPRREWIMENSTFAELDI